MAVRGRVQKVAAQNRHDQPHPAGVHIALAEVPAPAAFRDHIGNPRGPQRRGDIHAEGGKKCQQQKRPDPECLRQHERDEQHRHPKQAADCRKPGNKLFALAVALGQKRRKKLHQPGKRWDAAQSAEPERAASQKQSKAGLERAARKLALRGGHAAFQSRQPQPALDLQPGQPRRRVRGSFS